jgi:formylglycine-generating enzyme required for sulfatase activity
LLWVSQTVIPLSLWKKCIAVLACPARQDGEGETENSAATRISWAEITDFLIWLSNATGKSYRLASSDEWDQIHRQGQTSGSTKSAAMEIPRSADLGILVDEGVSEWTSSCESEIASGVCQYRIVRGASWEDANDTNPVKVDAFPIDARGSGLGFRVVRDH